MLKRLTGFFMVDDIQAQLFRLHLPKRFRDFSQAHLYNMNTKLYLEDYSWIAVLMPGVSHNAEAELSVIPTPVGKDIFLESHGTVLEHCV